MRIAGLVVVSLSALLPPLLLAAGTLAAVQGSRELVLRAGAAKGSVVSLVFERNAKPPRIAVRTREAGVAGSRLEVAIDKHRRPIFSHVFTTKECNFAAGASMCEVLIPASDAAYGRIVASFEPGRLARVTVLDAGVMKMDENLSLLGFTKRFR